MGLTGRKPLPASLVDATDLKRSKEEIRVRKKAEAKLNTTAELKCPKYVSDEARKEWNRLMKLYKAMETNILSDLDITALVMYCEATAIYKKAHEVWTKYNAVVASNPEAQRVLDKCFYTMERQTKIVNQLAEQLCLTPVGRARMGMAAIKNNGPSELEKLLDDDE
jgi:P27 family predicted phage terminase small subunit